MNRNTITVRILENIEILDNIENLQQEINKLKRESSTTMNYKIQRLELFQEITKLLRILQVTSPNQLCSERIEHTQGIIQLLRQLIINENREKFDVNLE